ncbi:hypothetical protein [Kineococcus arenarius]|uniref:hypothetical protein n=1 Tax=unclassified Kineococcus TaxID=2621656 RepID=UPI003D7CD56C
MLGALFRLKRTTWSLVAENATVQDCRGGVLILQFKTPGLASTFGRGNHAGFVAEALLEVTGIEAAVQAAGAEGAAPRGGRGAPRRARPAGGAAEAPGGRGAPAPAPTPVRQPQPPAPAPASTGLAGPDDDVPPPEAPIDDPGEEHLSAPRRPQRPAPQQQAPWPAPAAAPPAPEEDVPSRDDEDAEDSQLVGAAVVEQLLGGKVISTDDGR